MFSVFNDTLTIKLIHKCPSISQKRKLSLNLVNGILGDSNFEFQIKILTNIPIYKSLPIMQHFGRHYIWALWYGYQNQNEVFSRIQKIQGWIVTDKCWTLFQMGVILRISKHRFEEVYWTFVLTTGRSWSRRRLRVLLDFFWRMCWGVSLGRGGKLILWNLIENNRVIQAIFIISA